MSFDHIPSRVTAGITWLDREVPDWLDRIDLEHLDMERADTCIMGQLFDGWLNSPVCDDPRVACRLGFAPPKRSGFSKAKRLLYYTQLQAEWTWRLA